MAFSTKPLGIKKILADAKFQSLIVSDAAETHKVLRMFPSGHEYERLWLLPTFAEFGTVTIDDIGNRWRYIYSTRFDQEKDEEKFWLSLGRLAVDPRSDRLVQDIDMNALRNALAA